MRNLIVCACVLVGASGAVSVGGAPASTAIAGALAGPPLLCHPYDIGGHTSLPWGDDAFSPARSFDTKKLASETLRGLSADRPVLVRMETIRRASIYLEKSGGNAGDILGQLTIRALDAEAAGDSQAAAAAFFDAGYFVATCRQNGSKFEGKPGEELGVPGYAWVRHAIELSGGSPEMHFGATLVLLGNSGAGVKDRVSEHASAAAAGTEPGSLLAKNLPERFRLFGLPTDGAARESADAGRR